MPALTLRNIPDNLYQNLKRQAVEHHRSLNKEVVYLLEVALQSRERDDEAWLRQAVTLRNSLGDIQLLDDDILRQAKNEGRP